MGLAMIGFGFGFMQRLSLGSLVLLGAFLLSGCQQEGISSDGQASSVAVNSGTVSGNVTGSGSGGGGTAGSTGGSTITDTRAPIASALYPANGSSGVPTALDSVRIRFDEAIDAGTASAGDFHFSPALSGTLEVVGDRELRFHPSTPLAASTTYSVRVDGISDLAGNSMQPLSWSFSTAAAAPAGRTTWYISPRGSDANDGRSQAAPWKSFRHAFSVMQGGDELVLMDGDYSEAAGTGILRDRGLYGESLQYSAEIPSGPDAAHPTLVRALNPGKAILHEVAGLPARHGIPLFLGLTTRKVRFVEVRGLLLEGGATLYNTDHVTIRECGVHGPMSVGTPDHHQGNDHNLIEDVWVWARNTRTIVTNYRASYNVWRRIVVRSEGCDVAGCNDNPGKADPSPGITVYDSHDVSMQNILVVDRMLRNDIPYGDITTAQHTARNGNGDGSYDGTRYFLGRNEWLGSMSVNSDDAAMTFEADQVLEDGSPIWTVRDFLALRPARGGISLGNRPYNYGTAGAPPSLIDGVTVLLSGNGIGVYVDEGQTSVEVRDALTVDAGVAGIVAAGAYVHDSAGYNPAASEGNVHGYTTCSNCLDLPQSPVEDGSLLHAVEKAPGSALAASLPSVGAVIRYRYGVDGTRYGEAGYNTLTSTPLWPWPNEDRIKQEMCVRSGETRGFCNPGTRLDGVHPVTLTSYIWEFLGHPIPTDIYGY